MCGRDDALSLGSAADETVLEAGGERRGVVGKTIIGSADFAAACF